MKKYLAGDFVIMEEVVIIGLAAAVHLAATVFGWAFGRCVLFFGCLAGAALLGGACAFFLGKRYLGNVPLSKGKDSLLMGKNTLPIGKSFCPIGKGDHFPRQGSRPLHQGERIFCVIFALLFLTQLIFICMGDTNYREGDLTVETVGSFLATDGLYQVNPMTGLPYTEGLPSRLKILCLPTLYGSLCRLTGLPPVAVVWRVIPVITLVSCYIAFYTLSAALFPEEGNGFRERRFCFMVVVSFLMWVGSYQYGMDGFDLLCGGWKGVTIRNLVLLPWLLSLCLRKKWLPAVFCIFAEACIVWTLYGLGVCLPVLLGMSGIQIFCKKAGYAGARKD